MSSNDQVTKQNTKNSWTSSIDKDGSYKRKESSFRDWVSKDGEHPAAAGRYHLYVSYACPWANRTLILRAIKGLEDVISVNVVNWLLGDKGWTFVDHDQIPGATGDTINNYDYLSQIYKDTSDSYTGNITVPAFYDKSTKRIINNESSEIIRFLTNAFDEYATKNKTADLYPEELRKEIDAVNEWVYPNINNGVYRCGFARSQEAYEKAYGDLFGALDRLEELLSKQRYLVGDYITEADVRLFTTLVRFDPVYVAHFKCNRNRIADLPHTMAYLRELYQIQEFQSTVNFEHIKHHYFESHKSINPFGIVPVGPENYHDELMKPHGRESLGKGNTEPLYFTRD